MRIESRAMQATSQISQRGKGYTIEYYEINPADGMFDGFFHALLLVIGGPMCYNLSTNR